MTMYGKKTWLPLALLALVLVPGMAPAAGFEAAVGGWSQTPVGSVAYRNFTDTLSLKDDLRYDEKFRVTGRVKMEAPFFPGIYLMATPMKFAETGVKSLNFTFGNQTFSGGVPFTSKLRLDHYDVGLYYGIPFLKAATLNTLNIDLGVDARMIDFKAELNQPATGTHESVSRFLAVPMIYAGVQLKPAKWFIVEGEARGMAWDSNHYYDLIARAKLKPIGPAFISGGYRYEKFKIDVSDVRAEGNFGGPFAEVGVDF
jgi:outer membrane protein